MPLPLAPLLFKFLILKILKGAAIGLFRFFVRIFRKKQLDQHGETLGGMNHVNQVVKNEWRKKDNVVYLIIMLSSALYGLQELIIWLWIIFAKWRYPIFCTFTPAGLETPDQFVDRLHKLNLKDTSIETLKWIAQASLVYWPKTKNQLTIEASNNNKWINISRNRVTYMMRVDRAKKLHYRDMLISINDNNMISVTTDCGKQAFYEINSAE